MSADFLLYLHVLFILLISTLFLLLKQLHWTGRMVIECVKKVSFLFYFWFYVKFRFIKMKDLPFVI
ncbi:hypothetical protein A946_05775 [Methylacidiphilum kamchatkense Kam1]|uniref:Uncharacterized protein n=1 Tax=Methylacidiphilum kamchatkense Kam1 TaxID=1202785 RepID=A0ABR4ZXE2_9BACT|nr:hypothetical protein A946_05775 [Methylacidiphilum kamchatkense Kam1]